MWMALKLKNPRGSSNAWKVSLLAIDLLKIIDNRLDSFLRPEKGKRGSVTVRTSTLRFLPSFAHRIENITKQKPDFCGHKA